MTDTHLLAFDPSSDAAAIRSVLERVAAAGGDVVVVAGAGVVVRAPQAVVDAVATHPTVSHVGGVSLPEREPVRIRRSASESRHAASLDRP
jgi:heptaprenylglyceryl phosphate synthase